LGSMPKYGPTYFWRDVGANAFWRSRVGQPIASVWELFSKHQKDDAAPFGLQFRFEGADPFVVEYPSDKNHVDQIRIGSTWSDLPVSDVREVQVS